MPTDEMVEPAANRPLRKMKEALQELKDCKPNDKSKYDRNYAVTITKLEEAIAYFAYYLLIDHDEVDDWLATLRGNR